MNGILSKTIILGSVLSILPGIGNTRPKVHKQPNILFCIADDASYPYLSAYGCKWVNSPAFDRVAKEGILFSNAYTCNAKCSPSRASILTGRNSWQLKEAGNHSPHFPAEFKTIVEALGESGYTVGCTGKGWAPGDQGSINGQQRELTGKKYNQLTKDSPTTGISKADYSGNFEVFLNENKDEPWFFWFGGFEPHRNYEYGSGISKGGKSLSDIGEVPRFWPDNDTVRTDMLDYAFEVEYFDNELAKILDLLAKNGELDNTLIVVTSDNGMPFPRVKGQEYEMSNHLPLAMMWKNGIKKPGRTVNDMISFVDFAPTFAELSGLDWSKSGMKPTPGESLTDILFSSKSGRVKPERDFVLIGKERHDVGRPNDQGYPIRGIVKDGFLFLRNFETERWPTGNPETGYMDCDGSPTKTLILNRRREGKSADYWNLSFGKRGETELYDVRKDPLCINNLAGEKQYISRLQAMDKLMTQKLNEQEDPRMLGQGHIFDEYPYAGASRDFYNRYVKGEKANASWIDKTDFEKQ